MIGAQRTSAAGPRRGVTVVMVLGLVTISLALAYTITRSQVGTIQLQSNSNLDLLARQAAMTGFATGLRTMFDGAWSGVGAVVTGSLLSTQTYTVTYQTGDATLSATDTDWPYRVTLLSVGVATDPAHPTISAMHRVQAVVRLLPRQMPAEPSNFSSMLGYTVYQTSNSPFNVQLPCQVSGPVWIAGALELCDDYPSTSSELNQYLSDLNLMQFFGYGDNRPFTGPLSMPTSRNNSTTYNGLNELGVSTNNNGNPANPTGWNYPGQIRSYQLYAGGQTFTVPTVSATLTNTTVAADPRTNPLGLFYSNGPLTLGNNVTVSGTLIVGGDLTISGTNVSLQPVSLLPLQGTSQPLQLPTVVVQGNFKVANLAQATVSGLVASWNAFNIMPGGQKTTFNMQGRVIAKSFVIDDRTEWPMNGGQWNSTYTQFNNQYWNFVWFFPVWVYQQKGLIYTPNITVAPDANPVTYHWKDATSPMYIPNSSDPGLRWTLVRWTDDL